MGPWYRALKADPAQLAAGSEVLLTGPGQSPLLVLDRVEQGRVAVLLSDQLWLWSRGEDGGGPQSELLRRLAHWLMKEPELEEEQLAARIADGRITVTRRSAADSAATRVTVTAPDGSHRPLDLAQQTGGIASASLPTSFAGSAPENTTGIWTVSDGTGSAYAAARPGDPLELSDLRATATRLGPLAVSTGGGTHWLGDQPDSLSVPALHLVGPRDAASGPGWIGLRRHGAHVVTGQQAQLLLPGWLVLPATLLLLLLAWRREGRG